ncbi:topoisomerase C-terminal repeat-containing protein, partial [Escherichia coli]|nr:topoisomerase C-terminal repeat-containing protein [Escherichia coli]EJD9575978.1 topoisomerase C-terminal repeat-containing protein [Escherichia coli]
GYALIDALPGIAVNPDMTALWAEKQAAIENGNLTVEQFINELYGELTGMISDVDLGEMKIEPAAPAGLSQRLDSPCPSCGKQIVIRPKGYFCTGCEFKIWKDFCGKSLTDKQIETLITKGVTSELKGFISQKTNKEFSAKVKLVDKATGKLGFEFTQKSKK